MRKRKYKPREDWYSRGISYFQKLGKRRLKFYYRCGRCRHRKVLSQELWEYKIPPKCCGGAFWILDMDRYKAWETKTGAYAICDCGWNSWDAAEAEAAANRAAGDYDTVPGLLDDESAACNWDQPSEIRLAP
jgi:hypothetical protein